MLRIKLPKATGSSANNNIKPVRGVDMQRPLLLHTLIPNDNFKQTTSSSSTLVRGTTSIIFTKHNIPFLQSFLIPVPSARLPFKRNYHFTQTTCKRGRTKPPPPPPSPSSLKTFTFTVKDVKTTSPTTTSPHTPSTTNIISNHEEADSEVNNNNNNDDNHVVITPPLAVYEFRGQKFSKKYPRKDYPSEDNDNRSSGSGSGGSNSGGSNSGSNSKLVPSSTTKGVVRLDHFLSQQYELKGLSRSYLQKLIRNKHVTVDDQIIVVTSYPLRPSMKITLQLSMMEYTLHLSNNHNLHHYHHHQLGSEVDDNNNNTTTTTTTATTGGSTKSNSNTNNIGNNVQYDKSVLIKQSLKPQRDMIIPILYEDQQIIVLNKPKAILVHPSLTSPDTFQNTLVNFLLSHCQSIPSTSTSTSTSSSSSVVGRKKGGGGGEREVVLSDIREFNEDGIRPGIVHRLDKMTSGIMVIAKTNHAHLCLYEQFKHHHVNKKYLCLCHGRFDQSEGDIKSWLYRSYPSKRKHIVKCTPDAPTFDDLPWIEPSSPSRPHTRTHGEEDEECDLEEELNLKEEIKLESDGMEEGEEEEEEEVEENIPFFDDFDDSDDHHFRDVGLGEEEDDNDDGGGDGSDDNRKTKKGKLAISQYRVLETYNLIIPHDDHHHHHQHHGSSSSSPPIRSISLIEVTIRSGRTHQIRSQLNSIGHPILFDPIYRSRSHLKKKQLLKLSALTSSSLSSPFSIEESYLLSYPPFINHFKKLLSPTTPTSTSTTSNSNPNSNPNLSTDTLSSSSLHHKQRRGGGGGGGKKMRKEDEILRLMNEAVNHNNKVGLTEDQIYYAHSTCDEDEENEYQRIKQLYKKPPPPPLTLHHIGQLLHAYQISFSLPSSPSQPILPTSHPNIDDDDDDGSGNCNEDRSDIHNNVVTFNAPLPTFFEHCLTHLRSQSITPPSDNDES